MATSADATSDGDQNESFSLRMVSPSAAVVSPLSLNLNYTNTVKELKEKIRNMLDSKPTDDMIRLIYMGRCLEPDQNMLQVFGIDQLSSGQPQCLHLVIRDADSHLSTSTNPPSMPASTTTAASAFTVPENNNIAVSQTWNSTGPFPTLSISRPATADTQLPPTLQQSVNELHNLNMDAQAQRQAQLVRLGFLQSEIVRLQTELIQQQQRIQSMSAAMPRPLPIVNHPPFQIPAPSQNHLDQVAGQIQILQAQQLQPPSAPPGRPQSTEQPDTSALTHAMRIHNQLLHGPSGLQNQIHPNHPPHQHLPGFPHVNHPPDFESPPIRRDPASVISRSTFLRSLQVPSPPNMPPNQTVRREGVLPNGDRYSVTVSNMTTTVPAHLMQAPHLFVPNTGSAAQPIQADANTVATDITLPNTILTTPNQSTLIGQISGNDTPNTVATGPRQPEGTVVYLLSSPEGPRALLMHGNDRYYTTRETVARRPHPSQTMSQLQSQADQLQVRLNAALGAPAANVQHAEQIGGVRNMGPVPHRRVGNPYNPPENIAGAAQPAGQLPPLAEPRLDRNAPNPVLNGPANPPAADANARPQEAANRMIPHIWLLIRLGAFVWFFLSGNSSWSRWFTLIGIAAAIFLYNTGLLNETVERMWAPLRRHLDVLLPLAPPAVPTEPAAQRAVVPEADQAAAAQRQRGHEPSPDQIASRLIQQRQQADRSWLTTQFRRIEHAALLFMATLVPGVGERHIMARMEQEGAQLEAARVAREAQTQAQTATDTATRTTMNESETSVIESNIEGDGAEGSNVEGASTAVESNPEDDARVRQRHPLPVDSGAAQTV